jgi:hypothetical protein
MRKMARFTDLNVSQEKNSLNSDVFGGGVEGEKRQLQMNYIHGMAPGPVQHAGDVKGWWWWWRSGDESAPPCKARQQPRGM